MDHIGDAPPDISHIPAVLARHCIVQACLKAARGPHWFVVSDALLGAGMPAWGPYAARNGLKLRRLYVGLLTAAWDAQAKGPRADDGRGWAEAARKLRTMGGPEIPGVTIETTGVPLRCR